MSRTNEFSESTFIDSFKQFDIDELLNAIANDGNFWEFEDSESSRCSNFTEQSCSNNIESTKRNYNNKEEITNLVAQQSEKNQSNKRSIETENRTDSFNIEEFLNFESTTNNRCGNNAITRNNTVINRKRINDEFDGRDRLHINASTRDGITGEFATTIQTDSRELATQCPTKRSRVLRDITNVLTANRSGITKEGIIEKIKNENKRDRMVHDIADTRDGARHAFIIQKLNELKQFEGFFIAIEHQLENFNHFHFIHNCNYSNSCRCAFFRNIPLKTRKNNSAKLICDINDEYLNNLFNYFDFSEYKYHKIFFGQQERKISNQNTGNKIYVFIFFFIKT